MTAIMKAAIDPSITDEEMEFLGSILRTELSFWTVKGTWVVCSYGDTYEAHNEENAQVEYNRLAYAAAAKRVLLEYERLKKV